MTATQSKALSLRRLTLTQFRNYAGLRLEVEAAVCVLCGPNGAGKTNLLEAISLLAPGRGLRGASFPMLLRRDAGDGWAVAGEVEGPAGRCTLGTGWQSNGTEREEGTGRSVRIDGQAQKSSGALGAHMRLLWLTPAMDRLFMGPASDRRRLLDRLTMAFDGDHGTRILALERLLRERNRLLAERPSDRSWLASVEHEIAEAGVAVAAGRLAAVSALKGYISGAGKSWAPRGFPRAELAVEGELEALLGDAPAVQIEDEYRKLLHDSRSTDQRLGRTTVGPHRSDLAVRHAAKGIEARQCSTGEQKALLIGILLANARAVRAEFDGWAPLLLLDEVAAHLDEERRLDLFEEIALTGSQVWMTGTDSSLFAPMRDRAVFLSVNEGCVRRQMITEGSARAE